MYTVYNMHAREGAAGYPFGNNPMQAQRRGRGNIVLRNVSGARCNGLWNRKGEGKRLHNDKKMKRGHGPGSRNPLDFMVGMTGFEPATPWSRTRCSTRLSHIPTTETGMLATALPGRQYVDRPHHDEQSPEQALQQQVG